MRRTFRNLYFLLSNPPRPPWTAIWCAVIVLIAYASMLPFEDWLVGHNLSALKLAVGLGLVARTYQQLPNTVAKLGERGLTSRQIWPMLLPIVLLTIYPLLLFSDTHVQHAVTLYFAAAAIHRMIMLRWMPDVMESLYGKGSEALHRNMCRWAIASFLTQAVLNQFYILHSGAPSEWVLAYALTPIVMWYIQAWTLFATTTNEDFDR